jgi:hypothetical protein
LWSEGAESSFVPDRYPKRHPEPNWYSIKNAEFIYYQ